MKRLSRSEIEEEIQETEMANFVEPQISVHGIKPLPQPMSNQELAALRTEAQKNAPQAPSGLPEPLSAEKLAALRTASQKKGSPLTNDETDIVILGHVRTHDLRLGVWCERSKPISAEKQKMLDDARASLEI
jgi:hypothetical protein